MGKAIVTILIFIGILAGIAFGISWFVDNKEEVFADKTKPSLEESARIAEENAEKEKAEAQAQENQAVENGEASPAEEEKPSEEKDFTLLVLNGGDKPGSAGKVSGILEKAGFSKVSADNANVYTHKGATIYYTKDKTEALAVEETLKETYKEITIKEAETDEEKQARVVVILGE